MSLSTKWHIRPIRLDDATFAGEVFFHGLYNEGDPAPNRMVMKSPLTRSYLDGFPKPTDIGFVGEEAWSARPIGLVYARYFDHERHGVGFVGRDIPELSIAVMPGFRGQGCGTMLMTVICGHADGRGITISLNCHPRNPAHHLYERMGFEVLESGAAGDLMVRRARQH